MKSNKTDEIKKALEDVLSSASPDEVEKILVALDDRKILRYQKDSDISLLSTAGRVLVSLADDPTMTIRAISVYLGLSETMIDKTVKQLIEFGLITKTKVNRQNVYVLNKKIISEQSDIQQFLRAIQRMGVSFGDAEVGEQEPF